ncbi:calreticulin-3 [Tachyglossus aculeatus]|uniref:calreticulin-3 n=1 Tax=Tachyglossus aculeatus TaxID=9261 RepID=UPI0018F39D54|nr:calreticulin-3 [Tachyglossus aculeatus]
MAGPWCSTLLLLLGLRRLGVALVYFQEEFLDGDGWKKRWLQSTHDPNFGKFKLSAGKFYGDAMRDRGLQTTENSKFYAISSRFKPFSNRGKSLIIQYTVKHEQKIDCGGGYVKLFPSDVDPENLSENSYYYIMFGPDICGFETRITHVILSSRNKYISNKKRIRCKVDGFTHLYTLILRRDQTYKVRIDAKLVASGNINDDWDFSSLGKIENPSSRKREECAERTHAENLSGVCKERDFFLDMIGRKTSIVELPGKSMIQNPLCKSDLKPKNTDDQNYKEDWPQSEMKNEEHVTDFNNAVYENIGVIGLELWQVRSGTIFDNFLITDSEEYAKDFGEQTWGRTKGLEREMDSIQTKAELEKARQEEDEFFRGLHKTGFRKKNER